MNDMLCAHENDFRSSRPFFDASRMFLYALSGKGVQLPLKKTPDPPRVISPADWMISKQIYLAYDFTGD